MRIFAQKQNQPQERTSFNFARKIKAKELKTSFNPVASSLFEHDFSRIPIHPVTQRKIQTKLAINKSGDEYEQEADRVADKVMKMPEALLPVTAISASASVSPSSDLVQREPLEKDKKPELEFHSTVDFLGVEVVLPGDTRLPRFIQASQPEEGEPFLIGWKVWNTGWKAAPAHANSLTVYDAKRCSGCRNPEDEIYRSETVANSIGSITQPGKSEYQESFLISGLTAGRYEAFGELDVRKEVEEINEDNNTLNMIFDVKPGNKSEPDTVEEEETVQRKEDSGVVPDTEVPISELKGGGEPLPQSLRDFFEPRFGYDFSRVRIHSDARAAEYARSLHAKAFTSGHDVVFGENQYRVEKPEGRHLLAHELTHVVQQTKPTRFNK